MGEVSDENDYSWFSGQTKDSKMKIFDEWCTRFVEFASLCNNVVVVCSWGEGIVAVVFARIFSSMLTDHNPVCTTTLPRIIKYSYSYSYSVLCFLSSNDFRAWLQSSCQRGLL